jgi:hypothetical protein
VAERIVIPDEIQERELDVLGGLVGLQPNACESILDYNA